MAVWSKSTLIEAHLRRRIDSEFFRPAYVHAEQKTRRCNVEDLGQLGCFIPGPFGSAFHVKNYDFQSPYRYLRGRDIKPFFILDDDNRYVPEADYRRLKNYTVQHDDLLISVVGTLGNVAVGTSYDTPAIFSCKNTLFRPFGADPYYLLAFLNSHQGQLCLLRRQRGAVQTGLNIEDLKTIPIPRFDDKIESEIASRVRFAHKAIRNSKEYYTQAQHLLESELGLDKLSFQKPVGYTARFSELEQSRRLDPEHFYPAFKHLVKHLPDGVSLTPLLKLIGPCQTGVQPAYSEMGTVPVINSRHVLCNKIDHSSCRRAFEIDRVAMAQSEDVLLNATGAGTLGRASALLTDSPKIFDVCIVRIRPHSIDPVYLAAFLNTIPGQLQIERHTRGSSGQLHLYPRDVAKIQVWNAPKSFQNEVRCLIEDAHNAEKKADLLLAEAKTRVEQLIEEAVRQ